MRLISQANQSGFQKLIRANKNISSKLFIADSLCWEFIGYKGLVIITMTS